MDDIRLIKRRIKTLTITRAIAHRIGGILGYILLLVIFTFGGDKAVQKLSKSITKSTLDKNISKD